jgi:hypothetical protein
MVEDLIQLVGDSRLFVDVLFLKMHSFIKKLNSLIEHAPFDRIVGILIESSFEGYLISLRIFDDALVDLLGKLNESKMLA